MIQVIRLKPRYPFFIPVSVSKCSCFGLIVALKKLKTQTVRKLQTNTLLKILMQRLDTVLKSGLSKFCGRVFKSRTYLCVSRQYPLKFFKRCLPQNLLSPLVNTLSQIILILEPEYSRSSRLQMFYKVSILKNLAKFTGKHLCWRHFLIKMWAQRPATSLENDSDTGLFL